MRSLELTVTIAAATFALGMVVIASFSSHLVPVESPPARMERLEAN